MEVRWSAALERPVELWWNYQLLALICLDFQFALSYEIYKSRRWGDHIRTCVSSFIVSETAEPWHKSHTKNRFISFALARSSPNMASYWYYQISLTQITVAVWHKHWK